MGMNPSLHDRLNVPKEDILTSITKQEAEFIYNFVKDKGLRRTLEVGFAYGYSTAYITAVQNKSEFRTEALSFQ